MHTNLEAYYAYFVSTHAIILKSLNIKLRLIDKLFSFVHLILTVLHCVTIILTYSYDTNNINIFL